MVSNSSSKSCKKKVVKVKKNTCQPLHHLMTLTKIQKEILDMLLEEFLTPVQVAIRRRVTRQAIYEHVKALKKKGFLNNQNYNALRRRGVVTIKNAISDANWRYHNLHFVIRPYHFQPRYHKWRKHTGDRFYSGDWQFILHEDMVEMRTKKLVEFNSVSKWGAVEKSMESFNHELNKQSARYGFKVWKEGKANVRICNQHLEQANSGLAKGRKKNSYVAIKGIHDGKIYFTFDKSNATKNHEYIHSDLAVSDSEKFEPFFNSIRYYPHDLPHEAKYKVDTILNVQERYAKNIELHLKVEERKLELEEKGLRVADETLKTLRAIQKSIKKKNKRKKRK